MKPLDKRPKRRQSGDMTQTYTFNRNVRLRTSATRRFLIVAVMDGRARVEASTDDETTAASLLARYRREFASRCELHLIDQTGRW